MVNLAEEVETAALAAIPGADCDAMPRRARVAGPPMSGTPDRYTVRRGEAHLWTVWDTHRDQAVVGGEALSEAAARALARRLNDAYRNLYPDR